MIRYDHVVVFVEPDRAASIEQCVHPDLADNIWVNPGEIDGDDVDDDGNGWVDDIHGADCISNDGVPTASASSG